MGCNVELSEVITDIAAGPFGSRLKVSTFVPTGFPIIDGANLKGCAVTDNITKYVTEEKALSLSRSIARRGDVVVTISGNVGQVAYVPKNSKYPGYLCSQRQFRASFDTNRIYVPYLVFYLHSREGQSKILAFANQTGVPALSQPLKNFKKIRIDLPSLKTQMQIARVIETFNGVIDNLNRTNGYLLELMAGRCEGAFNARNDCELKAACAYVKDKKPAVDAELKTYVSTESLIAGKGGRQPAANLPKSGKVTTYRVGDTLISNIRPYFKKLWYADEDGTCSTDVLVFRANDPAFAPLLFFALYSDRFFAHLVAGSKGTKMPRGDKNQAMGYRIPAFDDSLASLSHQAKLVLELVSNNRRQEKTLSELRDTLLPKLMSGEIDVSKVELPTPPNSHLCA